MTFSFIKNILYNTEKYPNHPALVIRNATYSYHEFISKSQKLSSIFTCYSKKNRPCIILSEKTISFYAAALACFLSNAIYTPVNIMAPVDRNKMIIEKIHNAFIYIGDIENEKIKKFLASIHDRDILISHRETYAFVNAQNTNNRVHFIDNHHVDFIRKDLNTSDIAYLLFTSGSTGSPKGVPISYQNINTYLSSVLTVFSVSNHDRFIQLSDVGFDISIHEMLLCFSVGATLYIYDELIHSNVALFMAHNGITQCILIPSMIPAIVKQSQLFQSPFTQLKTTMVCGEAFPVLYAVLWESIAPASMIVNLYGPTEATVACTYHIYDKKNNYSDYKTVPIGFPLPGAALDLTDENEIYISGDQVSSGYWFWGAAHSDSDRRTQDLNIHKNGSHFVKTNNVIQYYTGDMAIFHAAYGFIFQGRRDDEWQVKGYRIEKSEVENILRSITGVSEIYIVAHKTEHDLIDQLYAFSTINIDIQRYQSELNKLLPKAVIPRRIEMIEMIPRLPNQKVNYRGLSALIEERFL